MPAPRVPVLPAEGQRGLQTLHETKRMHTQYGYAAYLQTVQVLDNSQMRRGTHQRSLTPGRPTGNTGLCLTIYLKSARVKVDLVL